MEEPSSPSEVTEAEHRKNEEDLEEKEEEVKTDQRVTVDEGGTEGEDQTENVPSGPRVSKEEAVKRLFEQVLWDANQENLKNFFLAHQLFIETKELLELWLALFRLSPEKVEDTGSKRVISLQRDRLLSVLIKWVKLQRTELLPYRQFVIESLEEERRQKLVKYRTRRGSFLVLLPDTNNKEERAEEEGEEDRETSRHVTIAENAVRKEAQEESEDGISVEQLVQALPAEAEVIDSVDEFLWTELQSSFLTTSSSGEGVDGVRPHRIRLETLAGPKAKLPLTSVRSYSSFEASKQNDAAVAKQNDVSSSQPVVTRQQRHKASLRQKWVRGGPVLPSPSASSSVVGASSSSFAAGAKERKGETSTGAFLGSRRLIAAASTAVMNSCNKDAEERKETNNTKPEEKEEKRTEDKTTSAEGSGDDANNEQDKKEDKEDNAKRSILKNSTLSAPSTPRADERPSLLKVHSSRQAVSHSALQTSSSSRQRAQTLAMTNNNNSAMEDPTNLDTTESIKQREQERKEREVDRRQRIALKHWEEISSTSCTALARELTAYDYDLFMKIPDSEFFEWQRSGSNDKAYHCPNIVAFIRRFDEVSFWVSTAILIQLTHKDRRKVVKSMIKLAKELHGIGNYNGLMQIISGLNNSYVQRLKSLWQDGALPDKYMTTFQDLEAVCSPLHNFTHYRKEFKERQAPKLPYFALFLRDLTIIKEANSLYTEEGLINSGLVQLAADFIRHFRSCHKTASPYHRLRRMTRDPALTSKLSYLYHVDEETLAALSSKIQPTKINTFAIEEVYSDEGAVINTPHPSGAVSDTAAESIASPADVEDIEHRDRALSQESYERYVRSGTLKFENERCLLLRADSLCGCLLRENQDGRWGSMQPEHLVTFLYDHSYSMGKNDAVGLLTAFPNLHQQLSYLPLHWNVNKTLANIPKDTQETLRFLDAAIFHCAHTGWGLAIVIDRPRDESATTQTPRPDLASSFPSSCSFSFQLTNNEATTYFPMRTEADLNAFCVLIDLEHSFEAESFLKRSPQLSGCYRRPRTPILQRRSRSPSPRRSSSSPSAQCKPSAVSNKRSSSPSKHFFSSASSTSSPSLSSSAPSTTPMPKLYTPLSSSPTPSSSTSPSVTFKSLALEMSQVATTIQNKTAAIKKKKRKEKKPTQEWRRSHRTRRKNEEDDERSAASCRCAMFAGYIGGWMEGCRRHFMENDEQPNERRKEDTNSPSADNPRLVAAEVLCRAKGDETCRFLLAYSPFIHQKVQQYFENQEDQQTKEEEGWLSFDERVSALHVVLRKKQQNTSC